MKIKLYITTLLASLLLAACSNGTDATKYIEEIYKLQDDIDSIIKQNGSGGSVEDIKVNPQQFHTEQEILNNISSLEEEIKALKLKNEEELKALQADLDEVNKELENLEINNSEEIEKIKNNLIQKKEELEKVIASYPLKLKEEEDRLQAIIDDLKKDIEELKNRSNELAPEISTLERDFKEKQQEMITKDLGLPNVNIKELSFSRHENSSVITKSYNYYKIVYDNQTEIEVKRFDDGNDEEIILEKKTQSDGGWLRHVNEKTRAGNLVHKVKEELDDNKKLRQRTPYGDTFYCGYSSEEVVVTYGIPLDTVREEFLGLISSTPSKIEINTYCGMENGVDRFGFTKHEIDISVSPHEPIPGIKTYKRTVSETYYSLVTGQIYPGGISGKCGNYSTMANGVSSWTWGQGYVDGNCYFYKREKVY